MKPKNSLLVLLMFGVFAILNTEMGIMGILPHIAEEYQVSLPTAGFLMSGFALVVAISGPTMPLLFSRVDRKLTMLLALGLFSLGSWVSVFTSNFTVLVLARMLPAFFHPVYVSLALSLAAESVPKDQTQKAIAKVFIGVSAGNLLGVPFSNFLANQYSLQVAFLFFALVNTVVFIATLVLVGSQPAGETMTYGKQLAVLKRSRVWIAIFIVIALNGATLGFSSYLTDYLSSVSQLESNFVSLTLLGFGIVNILGNDLAGRFLSKHPKGTVTMLPVGLFFTFIALFFLGQAGFFLFFVLATLGVLFGLTGNVNQYIIAQSASDAPDFANGLFLSAANIGVTVGTSICGYFIIQYDSTKNSLIGSCFLLLMAMILIYVQFRSSKKSL